MLDKVDYFGTHPAGQIERSYWKSSDELIHERVLLVTHAAVDEHGPGADAVATGGVHLADGGAEAGRAVRRGQRRPARGVPVREGGRVRGDVVEVVAAGPGRRGGHQLRQHVRQARREGVPGAVGRAVAQQRQRLRVGRRGHGAPHVRGGEQQQPQRDGKNEERWW